MIKRILYILLATTLFFKHAQAQDIVALSTGQSLNWSIDSLQQILATTREDITKVRVLNQLTWRYAFNQPEKGLSYFRQALALSHQLSYKQGEANAYMYGAWCHSTLSNYTNALQMGLKSLQLFEEIQDKEGIAWLYVCLTSFYREFGDYDKALQMAHQSIQEYHALHISMLNPFANIGAVYELQNRLDSALFYAKQAYELDIKDNQGKWGWIKVVLGNIYNKKKQYDQALYYYRMALPLTLVANNKKDILDIYNGIAAVHQGKGDIDSCIYYANEVLQNWREVSYQKGILDAYTILAQAYKIKNQKDSTIRYLELSVALNNKLFNQEKQREIQNLSFNEQIRQEEIEREREQFSNQLKLYGLLAFGIIVFIVALMLWRNNQQRKKSYALLKMQKHETDHQKTKAEQALKELQSTQVQLVQREKMASLGELTAGIAHEIQNPLNFVNNFSEVSTELCEEIEQEIKAGNAQEVLSITNDLKQNLEKIYHHGKRADSIVKGMLQHSRASSGEKQPTDINVLADEYLRLAYHGLRAKQKDFNADFIMEIDPTIGKIEVVPQEIGRVLLNLFNNAFYATSQKKAQLNGQYQPQVRVSTKAIDDKIEIKVRDNGIGISDSMQQKIFQPFFTTKPSGEGTGLGLSLSYDIITKGHGGELEVDSKEGEYTVFIITLTH